jgi:hypothetical protein
MKGIFMGKSITMTDFTPENFQPVVSVRLENVIILLMNVFPAFIAESEHIDLILALKKGLCFFPVMHSVDKHGFKLINCVVKPKYVSEVVLVNSSKVNFIIKIVGGLNYVKKLFRKIIVIL